MTTDIPNLEKKPIKPESGDAASEQDRDPRAEFLSRVVGRASREEYHEKNVAHPENWGQILLKERRETD